MERIDFIKEAVFLSGLSIEEVIQAFASDVSIEFLQELVQSQKEKLATYQQTTALSESERLVESPQVLDDKTEKQYELFTAESGKVQIGMFYYNEDKTFSRELIDGKQVSGVVGYFRKLFDIVKYTEESSITKFLFNTTSENIVDYAEDTSLRRKVKQALLQGIKFYDGIGILK